VASTSLIQTGGGFNSAQIDVIRSPYCLPGAGAVAPTTVYAISTYVDGVLNVGLTTYQNEDGDVLALTAAQIASLIPGECDRDYDEEGDLVCAAGVTLKRIETYANIGGTPSATPTVVFVNPATNVVVATPAAFTWGACTAIKVPITARVYAALGAVAVPATARREVVMHNRSTRDILVTWTGTLGGSGGTVSIPANGTETLSLTEEPAEGLFASMTVALDTGGVGTITATSLLFNFIN
jgi:hypothetical protein